ncbi:MAG: ABC transporter ATP-binding protein [Clostridia bacterium]|nr:ABC transporter ATP-binding protein [Clostridia bacterium]
MENKGNTKKQHSGPMGGGPRFGGVADKPKEFSKTLKRLIRYIGKYNKVIILVIVVLIFSTVLSTLSPKVLGKATTELGNNVIQKVAYSQMKGYLAAIPEQMKVAIPENATIQTLIDMKVIPQEAADKLPEMVKSVSLTVEPTINYDYIAKILLIILAMYFTSALFSYISTRSMAYIAQKVTYGLRKEIDEKLDRLPLKFFDKHTHGEILSRVTNDVDTVSSTLEQTIVQILQSVFTIIGILVMMISISLSMAGVAILIVPVSLIFITAIIKMSQKYFMRQQRVIGELNGHVEETYSGNLVIQAFNMQKEEINQFNSINGELYRCGWKSQFLSGLMMPIINGISNLGYVGICVLGAKLAIEGKMTIGNIQAFVQYTHQFTQPIGQTANMLNLVQGAVAAAERVFEILDETEEEPDKVDSIKIGNEAKTVTFDKVAFSYEKDQKLIENWSLEVNEGQTVAIVGPTGAGKTTIVNLLMRFYEISGGQIKINGVSTKDMSRNDLRTMFSMVLQDTWLFNGTIKENLRYGRQEATDEEIYEATKLAHAHHFIKALPGGYDFVLNEEASNISQGEKQLLTIARAIVANSPILILDEATSNVDTRTEELIQKAMNKLMEGRTSFVIAHRLSTIKNADVILYMEHGRIIERGTHDVLLKKDGAYAKLYNSQFSEDA